jgi:hypothetical protein
VREIYARSSSIALEELISGMIQQVASISRLLGRLSEQK